MQCFRKKIGHQSNVGKDFTIISNIKDKTFKCLVGRPKKTKNCFGCTLRWDQSGHKYLKKCLEGNNQTI